MSRWLSVNIHQEEVEYFTYRKPVKDNAYIEYVLQG
jgi:hypothetical protein